MEVRPIRGATSFLVGANLPWLTYGCDFGANAWSPSGGVARPDTRRRLRDALARLADIGASHVRWFVLCDGRAGIVGSGHGRDCRLDDRVRADVDAALEELDRTGMAPIFVLFDYLWFAPARMVSGVQLGGRGSWLSDPGLLDRTLDELVAPVLQWAARHPSVAAWDVINEPEWVTRRIPWKPALKPTMGPRGLRTWTARMPPPRMRAFIRAACALVHELTPHAATVGLASARGLPLVRGLGLDLYQVHWYDRFERRTPLDRPVSELDADAPILLGEFPTRASRRAPPDIVRSARDAGYAGALAWSAQASDSASDPSALASALRGFLRS